MSGNGEKSNAEDAVILRLLTDEERQARRKALAERRLEVLIKEIAREANALVLDRTKERLERLDELIKQALAISRMPESVTH
jgi:hypothetical protein